MTNLNLIKVKIWKVSYSRSNRKSNLVLRTFHRMYYLSHKWELRSQKKTLNLSYQHQIIESYWGNEKVDKVDKSRCSTFIKYAPQISQLFRKTKAGPIEPTHNASRPTRYELLSQCFFFFILKSLSQFWKRMLWGQFMNVDPNQYIFISFIFMYLLHTLKKYKKYMVYFT